MKFAQIVFVISALVLSTQTAGAQPLSQSEMEAKATLVRYFDALANGDTSTLRSLMGGDFLNKRSRLLDNPTYPSHLIGAFQNAVFSFTRLTPMDNENITADITITLPTGEKMNKQFLLRRDAGDSPYLVHNETPAQ